MRKIAKEANRRANKSTQREYTHRDEFPTPRVPNPRVQHHRAPYPIQCGESPVDNLRPRRPTPGPQGRDFMRGNRIRELYHIGASAPARIGSQYIIQKRTSGSSLVFESKFADSPPPAGIKAPSSVLRSARTVLGPMLWPSPVPRPRHGVMNQASATAIPEHKRNNKARISGLVVPGGSPP